jgi:hypothetical protein
MNDENPYTEIMLDDPQRELRSDMATAFNADWTRAQDLYQQALNSQYTPEQADEVYLAPVREKWKIAAKAVPQDKPTFDKFQQESNQAIDRFHAGINANYTPEQARQQYLSPFQQKWAASEALPEPPKHRRPTSDEIKAYWGAQPDLKVEAAKFMADRAAGMPEVQNFENHPMLYKAPFWKDIFGGQYKKALIQVGKLNDPHVDRINARISKLKEQKAALTADDPKTWGFAIDKQIGDLEDKLSEYLEQGTDTVQTAAQVASPFVAPTFASAPTSTGTAGNEKVLTRELARQFLQESGGNKESARQLAQDRGYTW